MNIPALGFTNTHSPVPMDSSTSSSTSGTGSNELTGDDFITLLTAQLKSQDPTSPLDPTQFMDELVSFNQLQQTIDIRQILQAAYEDSAATGTT
jgi:flagellar basal-body rod modification protein FlgD